MNNYGDRGGCYLHDSSYDTKAKFNNSFIIHSKLFSSLKTIIAKTCLPPSMLSLSSIVHV